MPRLYIVFFTYFTIFVPFPKSKLVTRRIKLSRRVMFLRNDVK